MTLDPSKIDKQALIEALRTRLEQELHNFTTSQSAAQEGATHEETRQEDPKDTRAIEATYLARGLAERVESLRDSIAMLARLAPVAFGPDDPVGPTALVALEGRETDVYFLVPCAAGETLTQAGATIRTLTPASPLGSALVGKQIDEEVELDLPGRRIETTIAWVR